MAAKRQCPDAKTTVQAKKPRSFDFSVHPKRKIAVQFFYLGWEYDGLVQQTDTNNTVEHHLMEALLKTHLIENWNDCDLSRCGRTDKGVSAFRQTVSLVVRSCCTDDSAVFWDESTSEELKNNYNSKEELPYLKMLNGVLPKTIRVFSWAPVPMSFNARFDCNRRTYKYAFPKADLDLEKMRDAASRLIGEHNYSNFCQIDMNEKRLAQSYVRKIYDVSVEQVLTRSKNDIYSMVELTVSGSGFLWHMIRYIVSVLHEIGQGNEEPQLITDMLDLSKYASRPLYNMASDTPLCLFDSEYKNETINWKTDDKSTKMTISIVQKQWAAYQSRSQMMENMLGELVSMTGSTSEQPTTGLHEFIQNRSLPGKYVKFEKRGKCPTIEDKKKKLEAMKTAKLAPQT